MAWQETPAPRRARSAPSRAGRRANRDDDEADLELETGFVSCESRPRLPHIEIAAVTGHSISRTAAILEVYLPRDSNMAAAAIAKLDAWRRQRKQS